MLTILLLALSLSSLSTAASDLEARGFTAAAPHAPSSPFTLEWAFTIVFQVGPPSPKIQPPDSSGSYGLVPILGGTISGPHLNGTLQGGVGYDSRFATYDFDDDVSYGTTDDGLEFIFIHSGVWNARGKVDRLVRTRSPT